MEYSSNANEVILRINAKLKKASDVSLLQRNIAAYLYAENWDRITQGKNVNENSIGKYSTKDSLVGAKSFINKGAAEKFFKQKDLEWRTLGGKKSGKKTRRLAIMVGGYEQLRRLQNRPTNVVNLQMTKKLFFDWVVLNNGSDFSTIFRYGGSNTLGTKGDWVIGWKSSYGALVAMGNEKRFGGNKIWGISKTAYKRVQKIEEDFINNALK